MTDHADAWILAIDFGTLNTAAAIRSGGKNDVLELSRGSRTMPSGVILDTGNGPRVGEMAERLRARYPHTYEENPKSLVGMPPRIYDGRPIRAEEFVAEIFREVRRIALDRKARVEPAKVVLTHPSAWGGRHRQQLLRAAESAGFERRSIVLLEEPIAAAHYFRHESVGQPIPIGGQVLVFDFGGGTLDLALVEHTEDGEFEVKDIEAIENLGGNNLDAALWDWTLGQIEARHPEAVAHLRSSNGRREEATLCENVRKAKEELSSRPATEIPVFIGDDYDDAYRLTAEEYEALIRPLVERAVALTRTLLDRNDTSKVVRFYLTGGSSLTPLVARALAQATGITPTRLGDPKTVVVDGALSAVAAVPAQPPALDGFLLEWVWPAVIFGIGVGYSISAIKLKRELGFGQITDSDKEDGFRSPSSLVSAKLLPGWFYKDSYTFLAPDGQANVIISTEELSEDMDTQTYADAQGPLLENELPGYEELAMEPYVVSGVVGHGWLREFIWTPPDSGPVQQTQIYVVLFRRGFTATATSPVSEYESHRADLSAILGSIRVHGDATERLQRWLSNDT
ncbi:Hsp70 family protein [Arthrobacter globiformis]|uniref:Hsp70 family protein n=1 Tax=Arthrobacter globiformis TaxID=1665 RepID=UPI00278FA47D|nr:Hsp70 family protein [Arthrobacter globiformis]MDQ0616773.1 actin-like ATPase involved in cell morphogenesis [Arthrobacter globiformis]